MVFHKMEHTRPNIRKGVLRPVYPIGGMFIADNIAQGIIQPYLIIERIHLTYIQVITIALRIIDLGHKEGIGAPTFDKGIQVAPELHRHHLSHIITEAIHAKIKPISGYLFELLPGIRYQLALPKGIMCPYIPKRHLWGKCLEVLMPVGGYAIVELDRLIPIGQGRAAATTITRPLSRIFLIGAL